MAEESRTKVQSFQEHLPLISAICNPGLRERHWDTLADIVLRGSIAQALPRICGSI